MCLRVNGAELNACSVGLVRSLPGNGEHGLRNVDADDAPAQVNGAGEIERGGAAADMKDCFA